MRKLLSGFLMILMLTPVLACMMVTCPIKTAQAAVFEADLEKLPPCHRAALAHNLKDDAPQTPMFMADCMGIDLFSQTASADLVQPDFPLVPVVYHFEMVSVGDFAVQGQSYIRAPPISFDVFSLGFPSLFLTTQRLRV